MTRTAFDVTAFLKVADNASCGIARRSVLAAALAAGAGLSAQLALAQTWPDKPVRLVVAFPAGGPADIGMRIVADRLSTQTGHNFIVDNRPGAGGTIGAELVANAQPDGYTLLLSGNHVAIAQLMIARARYDAVKSFVPVARFGVLPSGLFVSAASPHGSVHELLAWVRSHPDAMTYASGGNGTPSHLAMELLKRRADLSIRHIPYKGTPPAVTDLAGGQVDMLFTSIAGPMAQVRAGRLRLLAVSAPQRLMSLPKVPALNESVPGYEFETWLGVSAPRGTPATVVSTLSSEIGKAVKDPSVVKRMEDAGLTPDFLAHAEIASKVYEEAATYARVVRDANIKAE